MGQQWRPQGSQMPYKYHIAGFFPGGRRNHRQLFLPKYGDTHMILKTALVPDVLGLVSVLVHFCVYWEIIVQDCWNWA